MFECILLGRLKLAAEILSLQILPTNSLQSAVYYLFIRQQGDILCEKAEFCFTPLRFPANGGLGTWANGPIGLSISLRRADSNSGRFSPWARPASAIPRTRPIPAWRAIRCSSASNSLSIRVGSQPEDLQETPRFSGCHRRFRRGHSIQDEASSRKRPELFFSRTSQPLRREFLEFCARNEFLAGYFCGICLS